MWSWIHMFGYGKKNVAILMGGLGSAGKTAILHQLKHGEALATDTATIGFQKETVDYKEISFNIWEVGGQSKMMFITPWWKSFFYTTKALIFVVDSNDRDRIMEARDSLHLYMKDIEGEQKKASILVYANKQDLQSAMSVTEITDKLDLLLIGHHRWHVQAASAVSGKGLHEGLEWIYRNIYYKAS